MDGTSRDPPKRGEGIWGLRLFATPRVRSRVVQRKRGEHEENGGMGTNNHCDRNTDDDGRHQGSGVDGDLAGPLPLACPFNKRFPSKYNCSYRSQNRSMPRYTTCESGFDSLSLFRMHLFHNHRYVQCERCSLIFPGLTVKERQVAYQEHRRASDQCGTTPPKINEGIAELQCAQIEALPRSPRFADNNNKSQYYVNMWTHIWMVLFPMTTPPTPWQIADHIATRHNNGLGQVSRYPHSTSQWVEASNATFFSPPSSPSLSISTRCPSIFSSATRSSINSSTESCAATRDTDPSMTFAKGFVLDGTYPQNTAHGPPSYFSSAFLGPEDNSQHQQNEAGRQNYSWRDPDSNSKVVAQNPVSSSLQRPTESMGVQYPQYQPLLESMHMLDQHHQTSGQMYKEESGDKRYRTFKGSYPDLVDVPSWPIVNKRLAVAPSPKIQSACASRNSSLTSFTEDNTESGEDEVTGSLQDLHFSDFSTISAECLLSQSQLDDSLVRPVLSPMKQELVERMMKEFWAYFEQQTTLKQHDRPQSPIVNMIMQIQPDGEHNHHNMPNSKHNWEHEVSQPTKESTIVQTKSDHEYTRHTPGRESKYDWDIHLSRMRLLYLSGMSIPNICKAIQSKETGFTPGLSLVYQKFRSEGFPTDKKQRADFVKAQEFPSELNFRTSVGGPGNGPTLGTYCPDHHVENCDVILPVAVSAGESYIGAADLCDGGDNAPRSGASNSFTATAKVLQNSTGSSLGRRARDAGDDEDPNNDNKGNPKRPKKLLTSPQNEDDSPKYACPYRKRNPRKYCLHAQRWRSCALTPRESVARVKEHLYRQHSIFPCQRCKLLFEDQAAVDLHLREPQPCQLQDINHVDGITVDIVLKLKSKKKKPNQTEAERWKDIYRLLFPNDIIPDPHFEAVQEDIVLSPDSRALENYEDYCRQELPRVFRSELEAIIQAESEPIEERIRNRITNLIRDCQDQVFSSYRSSAGTIARTPSSNSTGSHSPLMAREVQPDLSTITNETSDLSSGGIAPFLLAPSPQSHLGSSLDISDLPKDILKPPSSIGHSDSGYSSGRSCIPPAVSSSYNVCTEGSSLPSFQSQSHATSQTVPSETQTTLDVNIGIPETDASNDCINSHESRAAGSPLEDYFIQFPDGTIWSPFADNMGNAGNTSYIENTGNTGNVGYMGNIRNMENIGSMEGFGDIGDMGSIGNAGSMNMGKISSMDNLGDLGNMGTGESLASSQAR